MSGSVNKVIIGEADEVARLYVSERMSLSQISKLLGVPMSTLRNRLIGQGVKMRAPAAAMRAALAARPNPMKGRQRPMSDAWKANIKAGRIAWGKANATGHRITSHGYVEFTRGPNKGRCEHVVRMEEHIGRALQPHEVVHHVNGIKTDNRIDNLALMTRDEHTKLHRILRAVVESMEKAS